MNNNRLRYINIYLNRCQVSFFTPVFTPGSSYKILSDLSAFSSPLVKIHTDGRWD
jgi:hypothetical protein